MNRRIFQNALGLLVLLLLIGTATKSIAQYLRPSSYTATIQTANDFSPCGAQNVVAPGTETFTNIYLLNGDASTPKTGPGPIAWTSGEPQWGWLVANGYFSQPGLGAQTGAYLNGFPAVTQQANTTPMFYYSALLADGSCAYIEVQGYTSTQFFNTGPLAINSSSCEAGPGSNGIGVCWIQLPQGIETNTLIVWVCVQAANSASGPPGYLYIQDMWVAYTPQT